MGPWLGEGGRSFASKERPSAPGKKWRAAGRREIVGGAEHRHPAAGRRGRASWPSGVDGVIEHLRLRPYCSLLLETARSAAFSVESTI